MIRVNTLYPYPVWDPPPSPRDTTQLRSIGERDPNASARWRSILLPIEPEALLPHSETPCMQWESRGLANGIMPQHMCSLECTLHPQELPVRLFVSPGLRLSLPPIQSNLHKHSAREVLSIPYRQEEFAIMRARKHHSSLKQENSPLPPPGSR